jgi:cellulose synthase/poly-beta-1,6-N-acetylglucosamine synthase-like glycosyltransferase
MSGLAATLLLLAGIALLVPALVLCIEVAAAAFPPRRQTHVPSGPRPRVDVLVPAHDEATYIEATVAALLRQLAPGDRVIVVADNCRDETAALALRAGACVLERRHPERIGKGYALAAGVEFTHADPPSVVLVVDADTRPGEGLVATLATLAHATGRPVQAAYTLEPPREAWLGARLSAFAFRLRNQVRPRGLARLGLPCGLTGSGMAIPWERLRAAALAHGRTAEDLALGVELALAGAPPLFCDDVGVVGRLPERSAEAFDQRRRWEHGHLGVALASTKALLRAAVARRDPALAALALDLCVPPLSLWGLLWLAAAAPAAGLAMFGGAAAPMTLLALAALLAGGAVAFAWQRFARDLLPPAAWRELPGYWLAKLPSHLDFLRRREDRWRASERRR